MSNTWAPHGLPPPDLFRQPIPGQIRLVNAIIPEGGARTQFPAVFSVLPDGTPILFAFSRARLGLTYYGETQVQAGQYTALASGDPSVALGVAADLPPGLIAAITVSISTIERAPNPAERLVAWRTELHAANSQIRARESCRECGRLQTICLFTLRSVRGVAQGITCPQLGQLCLLTTGTPPAIIGTSPRPRIIASEGTQPPTGFPAPLPVPPAPMQPMPHTSSYQLETIRGLLSWPTADPRSEYNPLPFGQREPRPGRVYDPSPNTGRGDISLPPLYISGLPLQSPSLQSDIRHSTPGRITTPQEGSAAMVNLHDGAGGALIHPRQLIRSTLAYLLSSPSGLESERIDLAAYCRIPGYDRLHT